MRIRYASICFLLCLCFFITSTADAAKKLPNGNYELTQEEILQIDKEMEILETKLNQAEEKLALTEEELTRVKQSTDQIIKQKDAELDSMKTVVFKLEAATEAYKMTIDLMKRNASSKDTIHLLEKILFFVAGRETAN